MVGARGAGWRRGSGPRPQLRVFHGPTHSIYDGEYVSFGGLARHDRDVTAVEIELIDELIQTLHDVTDKRVTLSMKASASIPA